MKQGVLFPFETQNRLDSTFRSRQPEIQTTRLNTTRGLSILDYVFVLSVSFTFSPPTNKEVFS